MGPRQCLTRSMSTLSLDGTCPTTDTEPANITSDFAIKIKNRISLKRIKPQLYVNNLKNNIFSARFVYGPLWVISVSTEFYYSYSKTINDVYTWIPDVQKVREQYDFLLSSLRVWDRENLFK